MISFEAVSNDGANVDGKMIGDGFRNRIDFPPVDGTTTPERLAACDKIENENIDIGSLEVAHRFNSSDGGTFFDFLSPLLIAAAGTQNVRENCRNLRAGGNGREIW